MNRPDAIAIGPEELIAAIRDFANHVSEPLVNKMDRCTAFSVWDSTGARSLAPTAKIPLVMDAAMDSITKVQDCPNCKKAFLVVNDPPVDPWLS